MAPCHSGARSTSAMMSKQRSIGASMSSQLDPSRSAIAVAPPLLRRARFAAWLDASCLCEPDSGARHLGRLLADRAKRPLGDRAADRARLQDAHAVELASSEQQLEEAGELVGRRNDIARRH